MTTFPLRRVRIAQRNGNVVIDVYNVPEAIDSIDGDVESSAGSLRARRAGLARNRAWIWNFTRQKHLQLGESGRIDQHIARICRASPACAEPDRHGLGDVVGEVGKCGEAVIGDNACSPLQRTIAYAACGDYDGAIVIAAEVAKLIFYSDYRLLRESNTCSCVGRRLRNN